MADAEAGGRAASGRGERRRSRTAGGRFPAPPRESPCADRQSTMSSGRPAEQRRHERLSCEGVRLTYHKATLLSSLFGTGHRRARPVPVRNIGRGGICFLSREAIAPGTKLQLSVRFGRREPRLAAEARVMWCGPGRGIYPCTVGARFTRMSRRAWQRLHRLRELIGAAREPGQWEKWRFRSRDRKSRIWGEREQTLREQ